MPLLWGLWALSLFSVLVFSPFLVLVPRLCLRCSWSGLEVDAAHTETEKSHTAPKKSPTEDTAAHTEAAASQEEAVISYAEVVTSHVAPTHPMQRLHQPLYHM